MTLFRISPAAFVLVFLLAACGQQESSAEKDESDDAPPIPVETSKPARGDIYAVYAGTAPIEAFAEADVIAKVDGEVREILFEEGQDVSAGDFEKIKFEMEAQRAAHNLRF